MSHDFTTPAIKYRQGGRSIYSFAMSLGELHRVLPARDHDNLGFIKGVNRAITPAHANRIRNYLQETDDWVLGSIIIAAPPDYVQFDGEAITVPEPHFSQIRIIDGQHRRKAVGDLLDQLQEDDQRAALLANHVSVNLYEVNSETEMRQMFASLANNKPIDTNTRRQFDTSNPFNNVAQILISESSLLNDRVGTQKARTMMASEWLLTVPEVSDIVTVLQLGYGHSPTTAIRRDLNNDTAIGRMRDAALEFFDDFLPDARPVMREIADGSILNSHLAIKRADSWDLDPTVIKFFANCYEENRPETSQPLAAHLADLDLDRNVALGDSALNRLNLIDLETGRLAAARDSAWRVAAKSLCADARHQSQPQQPSDD